MENSVLVKLVNKHQNVSIEMAQNKVNHNKWLRRGLNINLVRYVTIGYMVYGETTKGQLLFYTFINVSGVCYCLEN